MAQALDALWLPVLPSFKGFGDALVKGAGADADKSGKSVGQRFGSAIAIGVAGTVAAVGTAGAALYKVGEVFDEVTDTIRAGTGKSGQELEGLVDIAKRVGTTVPAEFDAIGKTVSDVSTRMGLTGKTLETVASQYLEAGRVLGEEVDVAKTSAAFNAFKIEGDDVVGAMDHLFQVAQTTGVGMNELAAAASRNAPAMQTLGFSFEETTAMVGSFDKAGLNSGAIMASMSKGLVTLAKDGEEPAEAFKRVQGEIGGFLEKGDKASALNLASKVFGTKGATQFIGALESGTLNLEDMSTAAGQSGDTILGVGEDTADFAEQWTMFKNNILVWLEPMGARVFGTLGTLMGEVTDGVKLFGDAWNKNDGTMTSSGLPGMFERLGFYARQAFDYVTLTAIPALQNMGKWLLDNKATLGIVAGAIGTLMLPMLVRWGVQSLITMGQNIAAFTTSKLEALKTAAVYVAQSYRMIAAWALMGVQSLLNAARMAAAWVIAMGPVGWIIAAVVGLAALIIANWDTIKAVTVAVFGAIASFVSDVWNNIVNWIKGAVEFVKGIITAYFNAYRAVIMAVFNAIVGFIVGAWEGIKTAISTVIQWIRTAIVWYFTTYKNIIMGIFNAVKTFIVTVWDGIKSAISSAIEWVRNWINTKLGDIRRLWETGWGLVKKTVSDIWNGIKDTVSNVWNNHIKPVFEAFGNFIEDTVKPAFERGVEAIKDIWDGVRNIARQPINFVIQSVYNNGLKSMFNGIAEKLGLGWRLPDVAEIPAFAKGGQMGRGWKLVGEEGPELINTGPGFVYTANQTKAMLAGRAQMPMQALSQAKPVQAHEGIGGFWSDAMSSVKDTFGSAKDWVVGQIGSAVSALVRPIKDGLSLALPGGGMNELIRGAGHKLIDNMSSWAVKNDGELGSGGYSGPLGAFFRPAGGFITSGFGASRGAYPHAGIDFAVPIGSAVRAMFDGIVQKTAWNAVVGRSGKGLVMGHGDGMSSYYGHLSDWVAKPGQKVKAGDVIARSGNTGRSTGPHLHAELWKNGDPFNFASYLHDNGGVLNPGLSMILNNSRKPEAILNNQQWADVHKLALSGGNGFSYSPTYQYMGENPEQVAARDRARLRDILIINGIS